MNFLQWTAAATQYWIEYEWSTFIVFVFIDILLLSFLLYRLILSAPFGKMNFGDGLVFTCSLFLTFWIVAYVLVNTDKASLSSWISNTSIFYNYVSYALVIIIPVAVYLYILYASYIATSYLTANDLKYLWYKALKNRHLTYDRLTDK